MAEPIKTKLSGMCGLIDPTRSDRWDVVDGLKDFIRCNTRRNVLPTLASMVHNEIATDIVKSIKGINNSSNNEGLVAYSIRHGAGEFQYRVELVYNKSTLSRAKKMFKELLLTTSSLDGLAGHCTSRYRGEFSYVLVVDCNDSGDPASGITRLLRLIYVLAEVYKLKPF